MLDGVKRAAKSAARAVGYQFEDDSNDTIWGPVSCLFIKAKTTEQKDQKFWTAAGYAQLGAFALQGGLAFPAGVSAGLTGYAALQGLRRLAEDEDDTNIRRWAREAWRLLFGVKGKPGTQLRRRLVDLVGSIMIAVLFGGATVTGLMAGLCAGAALTLVTTWQESAEPEWFEETHGKARGKDNNWLGII